jgi:hypothetical protein
MNRVDPLAEKLFLLPHAGDNESGWAHRHVISTWFAFALMPGGRKFGRTITCHRLPQRRHFRLAMNVACSPAVTGGSFSPHLHLGLIS